VRRPFGKKRSAWLVRATALALAGILAGGAFSGRAVASPAADPNAFVHEGIFDGPADLLWRLLTTEDGVESWLVPHAEVDLRVGGLVRTNYEAAGKIGDATTIVNHVVALTPGKSVSLRVDQTPPGYPLANLVEGTWYEVTVDPLANGRSRLRCVGHGLGGGPAAYMIRPMFDKAAEMVFDHLRAAVEREASLAKASPPAPQPKLAKTPARTPPKRAR